ncbi:adenylate kinase isoenzyme [Culex quinquefasciatus]|uniref:Adenylate kinase isoenzyme n=1 Tax=Culex quinquefasciatus TaxID=7176 RepID=B0WIR0_CULQU|nr:adenylate kinase isoenzyme [Culex quinquefasciatus]|eukprot:XP_001848594.1 adenylate kinase isoenzyme [Culex quinquefasciatus]
MAMEHESKQKAAGGGTSPGTSAPQTPTAAGEIIRDSNVPIIWVLGGPGCGKGTQCEKIVAKYNFSHFSTGDLLRDEVASGSDQGKELQEMMKKGLLVSNETVLKLLEAAMTKALGGTVGYLIDGYPREPAQGPEFEKFIAPVDIVLYFECSNILGRVVNVFDGISVLVLEVKLLPNYSLHHQLNALYVERGLRRDRGLFLFFVDQFVEVLRDVLVLGFAISQRVG